MEALLIVDGILITTGLVFWLLYRGWVKRTDRQRLERARREAVRNQATLASYRRNTIPGRRAAASPGGASAPSATPAPAPSTGFRPADTDPLLAVPPVYSNPCLHGHGGEFAGGGASGSWEPSSCGGSDYSSSSDSGSSCSSSSSSGSD